MEQNNQNTALLVMDAQPAMVGGLPGIETKVANIVTAISHARKNQIPVIYVVLGFRKGAPEININNKGFAAAKDRFGTIDINVFTQIYPAIAPQAEDMIVTKRRVSAFTGSDLDVVLRAMNIKHLVLSGFSTSGVVLSTITEAADKDYQLTVLEDCCADTDEEVHRVMTTKIFTKRGNVLSAADWVKLQ